MKASMKVRLIPTKEQEVKFIEFSNAARFVYNFSLSVKKDKYEIGESSNLSDLLRELRNFKYSEGNEWLQCIPEAIQKQSVKDMLNAFKNFYKNGNKGYPKFKSKRKTKLSFYQRTDRLRMVDDTHIKITGIKEPVKVKTKLYNTKYYNPRVSFDGKYWYLSYSYDIDELNLKDLKGVIGVDLGIRKYATVSNGKVYENINNSERVLQLEARKIRLQRKLSKKYELNRKGDKFVKTNNIVKLEKQIRLIDRNLKNIRENFIHNIICELVKTKPEAIVIEDLDISQMLKNRYLSKKISNCSFYKFRTFLEHKCKYFGIKLIIADRYYPSSKKCSCCNFVNKNLGFKETYVCPNCGKVIDRDLNASINLKNYGFSLV